MSKLYAAHQEGRKNVGFDVEGEGAVVKDVVEEAGVLDLYLGKLWGIKLATSAASTILLVDQVCVWWGCGSVCVHVSVGWGCALVWVGLCAC